MQSVILRLIPVGRWAAVLKERCGCLIGPEKVGYLYVDLGSLDTVDFSDFAIAIPPSHRRKPAAYFD
jgi:hypothetical protein